MKLLHGPIWLNFILLMLFSACVTKPGDPSSINSGNATSSEFFGPVLQGQSLEVEIDSSLDIDLVASNDESTFIYLIDQQPMYGILLGQPPYVTYYPTEEVTGNDLFYFSVINSKGQITRASVVIKIRPSQTVIYVRTDGDDDTGEVGNSDFPFQTAQAGVDAAIALDTSNLRHVILDFGEGEFGNVELTTEFGNFVTWRGSGLDVTKIGVVASTGVSTTEDDRDGTRSPDIIINSDLTISFLQIISTGGSATSPSTRDVLGATPGRIAFTGVATFINSYPGFGKALSSGDTIGADGGTIVVEKGSIVSQVTAYGASGKIPGRGGEIIIHGDVTNKVIANGASSSSYDGGDGGKIWVTGHVLGFVTAKGGNGANGGVGGEVTILGKVDSYIHAYGGRGLSGKGGDGGIAKIHSGASVYDINVGGGQGTGGGGMGGYTEVTEAKAQNIYARGGGSSSGDIDENGGAGGYVNLFAGARANVVIVDGGSCTSTEGGEGGVISVHELAIFNSDLSTVLGGVCTSGGTTGADGEITEI
jgi:hypothetical protein